MPDSQSVRDILDVMPDPWAWHLVDPAGRLPGELMVEIFGHLDQESLINAGQVSRRWRALAKRQCLWNAVDLHDTMSALHWQEFCVKYEAPSEFADIINLEVRRFLRKLVSAPYLRSLVLDSSSGIIDAPLTAILWAPISRVHTLEVNLPCDEFQRLLLKKFSGSVEVLKLWNLTTEHVPIINKMGNLKVLHFSNDKQCNGVPLFLPRDRCGAPATLVELRPALGRTKMGLGPAACDKMDDEYANRCHVFQSTVRSLVEVHAETLEVLQLPGHVNDRMLSALRKCRRLWKLFAPLQPRLAEVCAAVPSVRQLSVRFGSCKASARHLAVLSQLPPTVEELTLVTYRRSPRLGREYKALGQACRALFALKRLSVVCILCKKTVDVPRIASCFEEGAGGGALDLKCVELKYVNLMR